MKGIALLKKDMKEIIVPAIIFFIYYVITHFIWHSICPMVIVTGFPCPGCGLTRAGVLILHGKFVAAFVMHPFIYPTIILIVCYAMFRYVFEKSVNKLNFISIVLILLMCIYYVYRMRYTFPGVQPMTYYPNNMLRFIYESINLL